MSYNYLTSFLHGFHKAAEINFGVQPDKSFNFGNGNFQGSLASPKIKRTADNAFNSAGNMFNITPDRARNIFNNPKGSAHSVLNHPENHVNGLLSPISESLENNRPTGMSVDFNNPGMPNVEVERPRLNDTAVGIRDKFQAASQKSYMDRLFEPNNQTLKMNPAENNMVQNMLGDLGPDETDAVRSGMNSFISHSPQTHMAIADGVAGLGGIAAERAPAVISAATKLAPSLSGGAAMASKAIPTLAAGSKMLGAVAGPLSAGTLLYNGINEINDWHPGVLKEMEDMQPKSFNGMSDPRYMFSALQNSSRPIGSIYNAGKGLADAATTPNGLRALFQQLNPLSKDPVE